MASSLNQSTGVSIPFGDGQDLGPLTANHPPTVSSPAKVAPSDLSDMTNPKSKEARVSQCSSNNQTWNPDTHVRYINGDKTMGNLEIGVKEGLYYLRKLKDVLVKYSSRGTPNTWLAEIEKLERKAKLNQRYVIGVVGETGAGKSSLINALLEEDRILPTNGMRASTATVVEISYNHESLRYRAEVEFISYEEWKDYLQILFGDIKDGNSSKGGDEYAIAGAMIKAVYGISPNDVHKYSVEELVEHERVRGVLGQIEKFAYDDPKEFYQKVQSFVDSKDKGHREIEFWPLIRVVRVYVKAPVLKTGAVLADLPGVQDSNPARAEVANRYLKECSSIWVVAPIVRAVDNKTAKTLLGDAFKRQLRMDGTYDFVTFICTKADDISFTEVAQLPEISERQEQVYEVLEGIAAKILSLESEKQTLKVSEQEVNESIEQFYDNMMLLSLVESTRTPSRERCSTASAQSSHNSRILREESHTVESEPRLNASELYEPSSNDSALNNETADSREKHVSARDIRRELYARREELAKHIKAIDRQIAMEKDHEAKVILSFESECVITRNKNVKLAIQQDFAEGIREMDLADEDVNSIGASDQDYENIAKSLPVFCISARGYQQLRGKMGRDKELRGFGTFHETGILQLQDHCIDSTVPSRQKGCLAFLNNLECLVNSLSIDLSSGQAFPLEVNRKNDQKYLALKLERLQIDFEDVTRKLFNNLDQIIHQSIYAEFDAAASRAEDAASGTLMNWNERSRIAWNTYRAICRRKGVYRGKHGHYDWNQQLAEPMLATLTIRWERTFKRDLPKTLDSFIGEYQRLATTFSNKVEKRLVVITENGKLRRKLRTQLQTYKNSFRYMHVSLKKLMRQEQKTVSREIGPHFQNMLNAAYVEASTRTGQGTFQQMKDIMSNYINDKKGTMFRDSTNEIKQQMRKAVIRTQTKAMKGVNDVFKTISRDYTAIVNRSETQKDRAMEKELGAILKEITLFIEPAVDAPMAMEVE
ncbi:hypothetical protein PRK78_000710 [Emydomyces testavorans]|uniref:Nuclear GTPase SLIP-GC n=1 Tax=Emydomyces testavorans TaxID=2070801 RepID=A0AAF0DCF8_9EURO|nr:hypothetical protein PRK78_000710 [Emydomyces testavorans]